MQFLRHWTYTKFINCLGKVNKNKAVKLALWNSIVGCVLFCIARAILSNGEVFFTSSAPAVLYYFINRWILTNKESQDFTKKETDIISEQNDNKDNNVTINDNLINKEINTTHKNEMYHNQINLTTINVGIGQKSFG